MKGLVKELELEGSCRVEWSIEMVWTLGENG